MTAIVPVNAPHPSLTKESVSPPQGPISRFSDLLLKRTSLEGHSPAENASRTARAASLHQSRPFLPIRLMASAKYRQGPPTAMESSLATCPLPKSSTGGSDADADVDASPLLEHSLSLQREQTECDRGISEHNSSSVSEDSSAAVSAHNSAETMSSLALANCGGSKSNVSHMSETQLRVPPRVPFLSAGGTRCLNDSLVDEGEGDLGSLERFCFCSTFTSAAGVEVELCELSCANGGMIAAAATPSGRLHATAPRERGTPSILSSSLSGEEALAAADRQPLLANQHAPSLKETKISSPIIKNEPDNPNCLRDPQSSDDLNFLTSKHQPQNCFAFS